MRESLVTNSFHILIFTLYVVTLAAEQHQNPIACPFISNKDHEPCLCLPGRPEKSVEMVCQSTMPQEIFAQLNGYDQFLEKLTIKNCSHKLPSLGSLPKLKIRVLEISKCPIETIEPGAFDMLGESLEELLLLGNELTSIPPLNSLTNLKSVNLNNNKINDIPDNSFAGLHKLTELRVKFNNICSLQPNSLSGIKESIQLLDLSENCFSIIPAQMIRSLPSLRFLSLSHNNLSQITAMQFMNFPNLTELRLNDNQITRIQGASFMNVPKLKFLFLNNNNLSILDHGTLQTFKELSLIDISSNQFTKTPILKDLPKLVEARINNNKIRSIDTLTFSSNPSLRSVFLQNNVISNIAKNSFDMLDSLNTLMLANNSLTFIDRNMFDGIRNLRELNLRNNFISNLGNSSFSSLPELIALDLGNNALSTVPSTPFSSLRKLNFLSLSNNGIETIEENAFQSPISTVLLDGNPLKCDDKLDWFVSYVIENKVRLFLPGQPDVMCASPTDKNGTRFKDYLMQKAANSPQLKPIMRMGGQNNKNPAASNMLSQFLPGLIRGAQSGGQDAAMGSQLLGSLAQNFPAFRNIPSIGSPPNPLVRNSASGMESAIDQFTDPIVKFASGSTPQISDVGKLLSSLPNLVVRVPNFGDVDISKLSPGIIEHVLKGGQIPGIPRETLDYIVKQYMERVYAAAAAAQGLQTTTEFPLPTNFNQSNYLRPLMELPPSMITNVLQGRSLPHLSEEKTKVIKDYYTQQIPIPKSAQEPLNLTDLIPPKLIAFMNLLPPDYPINKLPPEVLKSALSKNDELPDFSLLPEDLQIHIRNNFDKFIRAQQNMPGISIDEILKHAPYFDRPQLSTFSPYDINRVDSDLVIQDPEKNSAMRLYTAMLLGLIAAVTLSVLTGFCVYLRNNRAASAALSSDTAIVSMPDAIGTIADVVREQSFRPSASSTLRSMH